MRGASCWNTPEPVTLTTALDQQAQQLQQQQEERQQSLQHSAATPAWGLMVNNNAGAENLNLNSNLPKDKYLMQQANYGNYNYGGQQSMLQANYPEKTAVIKSEPQEPPGYDSGRETLHDAEEDDMIEMSPEVLIQAETSSSKEINSSVVVNKQPGKKQMTRKMLKCPMCHFESDNTNRDHFMDHLLTHCAMVQRSPPTASTSSSSTHESLPADDDSENEPVVDDDANLRMPHITAQGNVKFYRCKKCKTPSLTKYDSWIHQREHMTPEKILYCKVCPFATEYKHHLEYHMRNHYGSKPFKCTKCNYTCVNKSMLNSHLKSHSSVYQYRCASCTYVTKYCHSLKVHLKRNAHEPAVVLNPDGTPNPNPIIDVNSSRRGPRNKPQNLDSSLPPVPLYQNTIQNYSGQHFGNQGRSYPEMQGNLYNSNVSREYMDKLYGQNQQQLEFNPENLAALQNNLAVLSYMKMLQDFKKQQDEENEERRNMSWNPSEPLDLSNHRLDSNSMEENLPAKKKIRLSAPTDSDNDSNDSSRIEVESLADSDYHINNVMNNGIVQIYKSGFKHNYSCRICDIIFRNEFMFTIHMGYHGRDDPLCCNICGEKCPDRVTFFVHVTRNEH